MNTQTDARNAIQTIRFSYARPELFAPGDDFGLGIATAWGYNDRDGEMKWFASEQEMLTDVIDYSQQQEQAR